MRLISVITTFGAAVRGAPTAAVRVVASGAGGGGPGGQPKPSQAIPAGSRGEPVPVRAMRSQGQILWARLA